MENLGSSNEEVMMPNIDGEMQTLPVPASNDSSCSVNSTHSADFSRAQTEETTHEFSDAMAGVFVSGSRGEESVKEVAEFGSCDSESSGTEYNSCTTSPKLERAATVSSPTHKRSPISISPEPEMVTDELPKQQEDFNTDSPAVPERADNIMRSSPDSMTSSQADITSGSVSMSANIADKLSQMRVSRESLDGEYRVDCEDLGMDNKHDAVPSDVEASVGPSRKPSQKSSLRQVFPYISCLPFENNMVFCFVLSVWDNIVGPQTVYVWKRKAFPTQKTFEVFDEPGDIEIGEDTVKGDTHHQHNPTSQMQSKNLERQSSIDTVHHQKKSTVSNISSSGRKQSQKYESSPKHISSVKPQDGRTRNINSVESFCEDFGNNILMESLNAIKADTERPMTPPAHVMSQSGQHKDTMVSDRKQKAAPKLSLPRTNSMATGEPEDRGGGGVRGWWYGRGKLRVGAVAWYVTEHSVGVGQVGPTSDKVTSTLHVVPHQGIIILAAR